MSEAIYDAEIAPQLLAIAKRCEALNIPFIAVTEYEPGKIGRTSSGIDHLNIPMMVVLLAAQHGNDIDSIMLALAQIMRKHNLPNNSIAMMRFLGDAQAAVQ